MSTYTGQAGLIKIGSDIVAELRSFTIDQTQDTVEVTAMQAAGSSSTAVSRSYKPGLSTFTISGDIYFDGDDTAQAALEGGLDEGGLGTALSFKVYPAGVGASDGKAFSGSAIMTSFSVSSSVDGAVEASFAAQGTGDLTMDDAESIT
jgi:predicted secreted protein